MKSHFEAKIVSMYAHQIEVDITLKLTKIHHTSGNIKGMLLSSNPHQIVKMIVIQ